MFYYQGLQKVKTCIRPSRSKYYYLRLQKVKTFSGPLRSKFHYIVLQKAKNYIHGLTNLRTAKSHPIPPIPPVPPKTVSSYVPRVISILVLYFF